MDFADEEERYWTLDDGHVSNFGLGAVLALMWLRQADKKPLFPQHLTWAVVRSVPHLEHSTHWQDLVGDLTRDDQYLTMLTSHVDHVQGCPNESKAALGVLAANLSGDQQVKLLELSLIHISEPTRPY